METIEMLINELGAEISRAKKAPFSASEVVLNRQTLLELTNRLRENYPAVIKEATQITKERDEILAKAEAYALDVMNNAEAQAKKLVEESEIVKAAKVEAESVRDEAKDYYRRTEYNALHHAYNILDNLENVLVENLNIVKNHKDNLSNQRPAR